MVPVKRVFYLLFCQRLYFLLFLRQIPFRLYNAVEVDPAQQPRHAQGTPQSPLPDLMHCWRTVSSCSALGLPLCSCTLIWYSRGQYLPVTNMRCVAAS